MRRGRSRDGDQDFVDVALDDGSSVDGTGPDATPGVRPDATGGDGTLRRARRGRLALLVVVVVAGVVVAVAVSRSTDPDAPLPAAPTGLAGAASLDEPLRELWRADDVAGVIAADDQVVAVAASSGHPVVRAFDAASGDLVWQREGARDESCVAAADDAAEDAADRAGAVVCSVGSSAAQAEGPVAEAPADVVVLDLASGAELGRTELPAPVLDVEPLTGGDVLLVWADAAGAVHAERWGPGPGARWTVDAEADALARVQADGLVVRVAGDSFWFGAAGSPERDLATGSPVAGGAPATPPAWTSATLPGGGRIEQVIGTRGQTAHVVAPDGTAPFVVDGVPLEPSLSDGVPSDVLVFQLARRRSGGSGDVVGLDAPTGTQRWSLCVRGRPAPVVRVAGVLVLNASGRVLAVDAASGQLLWDSGTSSWTALGVTDGRSVLVRTQAADGAELTAVDLASGDPRWSVPVRSTELRSSGLVGGHRAAILTVDGTLSVLG